MNYFDKALTGVLDGIERNVVEAAAALEEFPGEHAPTQHVEPAEWEKAPQVIAFWKLYNLKNKKEEFRAQLQRIAAEKSSKDRSIPGLIRRAEESENVVRELCERLLQAPDILPYLCEGFGARQVVTELEKENKRLLKNTEAAEKEATSAVSVVNQAQKAEAAQAELIQQLEKEKARVSQLQGEMGTVDELRFQVSRAESDLHQTRQSFAALQTEYQRTQNELFELRSIRDAEASAKADDLELAATEHELALTRIRQLEHALLRCEQKLEQAKEEQNAGARSDAEKSVPEDPASVLDSHRWQAEIRQLQARYDEDMAEAQECREELHHAQHNMSQLQAELDERMSREEAQKLRERLRTAEALLDAQMAVEGDSSMPGEICTEGGATQSLVATLQARNRRLVADNSALRHDAEEAKIHSEFQQGELKEIRESKASLEALVARLEQDLLSSLQNSGREPSSEGEIAKTGAGSNGENAPAGNLLKIVTSQRDRFRLRVEELEVEAENARKGIQNAEGRIKALEKDNLGLFERIKYLQQRYQPQQSANAGYKIVNVDEAGIQQSTVRCLLEGASLGHRMSCGPLQLHLGGGGGAAVRSRGRNSRFSCLGGDDADEDDPNDPKSVLEQRYSKAYDSKINPFAEFQASERESRLPAHDRALLAGSKMILSNRAGRVFAVLYFITLHLFLFCLVYYIIVASAIA